MWKIHSLRSSSSSSSSSASSSIPFPPQQRTKGVRRSTTARHCTHFFMRLAQSGENKTFIGETWLQSIVNTVCYLYRCWPNNKRLQVWAASAKVKVDVETCVTYSHKRTCDHRAGTTRLLFCQSRPRTPQSLNIKQQKRIKVSIHSVSYLFLGGKDSRSASDTLVLDWTWSLQMRHFLTRGEQREQVAMCPQGPNRVSLFMSEQTIHSSSDSILLFRDGLRVPTWLLKHLE